MPMLKMHEGSSAVCASQFVFFSMNNLQNKHAYQTQPDLCTL
jgi:hypothetical protein